MYTYSQTKSERISAKERKEHHFNPTNSLSHSNSKSSTQSKTSAAVKMSPNPSNTSHFTQGARGDPINPSSYSRDLENEDLQQQGNNNQGGNAASGGNTNHNQNDTQGSASWDRIDRTQGSPNAPWTGLESVHPGFGGGSQAQGGGAGTGQGAGQGGGHGSGNTEAGRGGYQNGHAPSTSATWGSSTSGRSSGGQA